MERILRRSSKKAPGRAEDGRRSLLLKRYSLAGITTTFSSALRRDEACEDQSGSPVATVVDSQQSWLYHLVRYLHQAPMSSRAVASKALPQGKKKGKPPAERIPHTWGHYLHSLTPAGSFDFSQIHPWEPRKPSGLLFGGIIGRTIGDAQCPSSVWPLLSWSHRTQSAAESLPLPTLPHLDRRDALSSAQCGGPARHNSRECRRGRGTRKTERPNRWQVCRTRDISCDELPSLATSLLHWLERVSPSMRASRPHCPS